jgi:hypothetical protein
VGKNTFFIISIKSIPINANSLSFGIAETNDKEPSAISNRQHYLNKFLQFTGAAGHAKAHLSYEGNSEIVHYPEKAGLSLSLTRGPLPLAVQLFQRQHRRSRRDSYDRTC